MLAFSLFVWQIFEHKEIHSVSECKAEHRGVSVRHRGQTPSAQPPPGELFPAR